MSRPTSPNWPQNDVLQCRILDKSDEVAARLRELRINPEVIREVRTTWARAEASVSPFGPKNGAGMEAWLRAIEILRELLCLEGWTMVDVRGIAPYVLSPDGTLALTVASGDFATGLRHLTPITKNPKGIVVAEAVERNWQQLTLDFGGKFRVERTARQPRKLTVRLTMILLMATIRHERPNEPVQTEYRAELSTPLLMTKKRVTGWSERILLPFEGGDGGAPTLQNVPGVPPDMGMAPEPIIQVPRKKGA